MVKQTREIVKDKIGSLFIQAGRICDVNYGEDLGKLVVILGVVDYTRVAVWGCDGTLSDVKLQEFPVKRLTPTRYRLTGVMRNTGKEYFKAAIEEQDFMKTWEQTNTCIRRKKRDAKNNLDDFGRFKLYYYKKHINWEQDFMKTWEQTNTCIRRKKR